MRSPSRPAGKLSAREICILALMGALIFAEKVAFSAIPNVNLNAVLIILTTVFFGWRALCSVLIYIMLEGLVYGGNSIFLWWFSYLYAWPAVTAFVMLFPRICKTVKRFVGAVFLRFFVVCVDKCPYKIADGWFRSLELYVYGVLCRHCHSAAGKDD